MGRKAKTTLIQEEYNRIMAHYADLPKNQMAIVEPLIQNAAFMKITLDDLQKSINADGCSEEYMNGANQYGNAPSGTMRGIVW